MVLVLILHRANEFRLLNVSLCVTYIYRGRCFSIYLPHFVFPIMPPFVLPFLTRRNEFLLKQGLANGFLEVSAPIIKFAICQSFPCSTG